MVRPRSGAIMFDGREVAGKPAHAIAKVGMQLVPEELVHIRQPQCGGEHRSSEPNRLKGVVAQAN